MKEVFIWHDKEEKMATQEVNNTRLMYVLLTACISIIAFFVGNYINRSSQSTDIVQAQKYTLDNGYISPLQRDIILKLNTQEQAMNNLTSLVNGMRSDVNEIKNDRFTSQDAQLKIDPLTESVRSQSQIINDVDNASRERDKAVEERMTRIEAKVNQILSRLNE